MHILTILVFVAGLATALEVIRRMVAENGTRIIEALAGVSPEVIEIPTGPAAQVLPFKPVVIRPAFARAPERLAA